MIIEQLDHLVLTVRDIKTSCDFYQQLLGMDVAEFEGGRKALVFGSQKINLHLYGNEIAPHAAHPTPGAADLCFLTSMPIAQFLARCSEYAIDILAGPVQRSGASGPILSVYLRDPDGNLLEIANTLSSLAEKR